MKKSWKLLDKILSGEKTIESRWYQSRRCPWDRIHSGDTIWFKNSGEPVTLRATVKKVLQFDKLTPPMVGTILDKYGEADGIADKDKEKFYQLFRLKKFCLLIFLKDVREVQPFTISKKGYGAMAAWITAESLKPDSKPLQTNLL